MVRAPWNGKVIEDEGHAGPRRSLFDRFRRVRADDVDELRTFDDSATAPVSEFDDASLFEALQGNVTIADFWAPWCGPCKTLHPMFERAAAEHAGVAIQFARVNVDDSPGVTSAFDIMSIPTILVFDDTGTVIGREVGLPSKRRLDQLIRVARSATQHTVERGAA